MFVSAAENPYLDLVVEGRAPTPVDTAADADRCPQQPTVGASLIDVIELRRAEAEKKGWLRIFVSRACRHEFALPGALKRTEGKLECSR